MDKLRLKLDELRVEFNADDVRGGVRGQDEKHRGGAGLNRLTRHANHERAR